MIPIIENKITKSHRIRSKRDLVIGTTKANAPIAIQVMSINTKNIIFFMHTPPYNKCQTEIIINPSLFHTENDDPNYRKQNYKAPQNQIKNELFHWNDKCQCSNRDPSNGEKY